jgi:hypothetical protein
MIVVLDMIRSVTSFLLVLKTGSCVGGRIPYSAVLQLIESSLGHTAENTSRILKRDEGNAGCMTTELQPQTEGEWAAVVATKHAWTFSAYVLQISDYHITQNS